MIERNTWKAEAERSAEKLAAMEMASTGTMQERFSIRHMRLYIAVCERFHRHPGLSEAGQFALAERFLRAGNSLARRYGATF